MGKRTYSDELKQQIIKECREIGNTALVARRHNISSNTVYTWLKKAKENGSVKSLPEDKEKQLKEFKKRTSKLSSENDQLKRILAEKELEFAVLRDSRAQMDPQ